MRKDLTELLTDLFFIVNEDIFRHVKLCIYLYFQNILNRLINKLNEN